MKRIFVASLLLLSAAASVGAQTISLPVPAKEGGLPVNRAFAERRSVRSFDSARELSMQTVSDILWAACGINRPESGLRTNPTARNVQEVDAYWFDKNGVYKYDFQNNALIEVAAG